MDFDKYENKLPYPPPAFTVVGEVNVNEREELRKQYRQETGRLEQLFQTDALKEVGLQYHPKASAIFNHAWEQGHVCGYHEVWNELLELAELFKD